MKDQISLTDLEALAKEFVSGLDNAHQEENYLTPKRSAEIEIRDFLDWLKDQAR